MASTRVIKKYPNRRLYDTEISSYITIEDVRQKVGYDLDYIHRQGFWADLWIMAQTIPVMLFRKGSR